MDRDMICHKIDRINGMIIVERLKESQNRYGVRLHHPERKSLDIMLDIEALEALVAHYKSRLKDKAAAKKEDRNTRLIEGALENYQKGKLVDAGVELQIVVNRINAIIEERFIKSQNGG